MEKWILRNRNTLIENLEFLNISPNVLKILINRGFKNFDEINNYINPDKNILKDASCLKDFSKAINILKDIGLINYKTYGDINLTEEGNSKAKEIIKKYDILRTFLTEILEVEQKQAEKDAKVMKYAVSEQTIKKLDEYIGKILNLGDLDCDYDENSEKCRNCIKITVKNRIKQ